MPPELASQKQDSQAAPALEAAQKRISSDALFGSPLFGSRRREVLIVHNGREYRLRLTQNGKLILTA